LVKAVPRIRRLRRKGFFEFNQCPRAAISCNVAGVHGLLFIISANKASRTPDDLPFLNQIRNGLIQRLFLLLTRVIGILWKFAERQPLKSRQHLPAMVRSEEVQSDVCGFG